MRYFQFYTDDTLHGLARHDSGYLVGRKPIVLKMMSQHSRKRRKAVGASTRLGQQFVEKLNRVGFRFR